MVRILTSGPVLMQSAAVAVFLLTAVPVFGAEADGSTESAVQRMAARAAAESGDFVSAATLLRDASRLSGDDAVARRAEGLAQRLQGGSGQADFGELIALIQEQTSPPAEWSDNDGQGGTISTFAQGVFLGGPAVLASVALRSDGSRLDQVAREVSRANPNRDVHMTSSLRLVSLTQLERHLAELARNGQAIPDDVRHLAGISRVQYLMTYPETGDVVIGGPAADWVTDADGRSVSVADGRPVLQLDDLVVLSRTFSADGPSFFMCSIDPRQEQVQAVNDFVRENRSALNKRTAAQFTQQLEKILGLQNVIVQGIPADSRVAKVIVDADYRMKQIGIGAIEGAPGMKSYFDLLSRAEQRGTGSMDALRWWMSAGHESIQMSASGDAYQFTGQSVRCLAEDQIVNADGTRVGAGEAQGANAEFARLFTRHFEALAADDAVFADLQNVFDLAMVSALVGSQGLTQAAHLDSAVLQDVPVRSAEVPTELMTSAAWRVYSGRHVVVQVAGGVRADMATVVRDADRFRESEQLQQTAIDASPVGHGSGAWWWDAAGR